MAQTYAVYFGTLFIIGILAFFSEKYDNKKLVYLIIAILTMVAGLRKYTVGFDSFEYYQKFQLIAIKNFDAAYGLEKSFKYVCYFLQRIFNNYNFLFSVFAFITSYLIVVRLWDLRKISSFFCSVTCYYMAFFAMSLNGMRQFVAISIIFFATKFLVESRFLLYLVSVGIAMIFHKTGIEGLLLFGLMTFNWNGVSYKKRVLYLFEMILIVAAVIYIIDDFSVYQKYMSEAYIDIGVMLFGKLLFFIATSLFVFLMRGNNDIFAERKDLTYIEKRNTFIICVSYFIGIIFSMSSYVLPILNRIGWYFFIFEGAYMGMLFKTKNPANKLIYIYCIVFFVGWGFFTSITNNAQGTVPYTFFWQ